MGVVFTLTSASPPLLIVAPIIAVAFLFLAVVINVLNQILFKNRDRPPVVFHWFPFIGSTVAYGQEPLKFFRECKAKYGDVFTFILLGKPTTVCLGAEGNNFVLNGKHHDLSAEDVYSPLTTPVFGKDVIFDCPNAKLVQQKKFVKFGLTAESLRSYVRLIAQEADEFFAKRWDLQGSAGIFDVPSAMAELTIYTASRSLQGKEVRAQLDGTIAELYHDLDMGFAPINFMLSWAPLPRNRARDRAQVRMTQIYMEIIQKRRLQGAKPTDDEDMIWNLMSCSYRDGKPLPDKEIAHMMIALLLGGHHSSSSTISFTLLQLARCPSIAEELYQEQQRVLGPSLKLTYEGLQNMTLHQHAIKETLRLHNPVHSIMRQVKSPLVFDSPGGSYIIPPSHVVLASPASSSRDPMYFSSPLSWDPHRWTQSNTAAHVTDDNEPDEEDAKTGKSRGSHSPYLPFGGGRHRCIGERFAYVQLCAILCIFVRHFKVRPVDTTKTTPETDYSSLFSRPRAPANLVWERKISKEA